MLNKDNIKNFLRNPLGVIALFVTICYLIAGLVFSIGLDKLNGAEERLPFIWFIIIFPVVIFVVFVLLVCYHHEKLYGPTDFKNEDNFVKLTNAERKAKYLSEATENSKYEEQMPINIEDSEEVIKERLEIAKDEIKCKDKYDYVVINNTVDKAVEEIIQIIKNEKNICN